MEAVLLTEILGSAVVGPDGKLGKVADLGADPDGRVLAIHLKRGHGVRPAVAWSAVESISEGRIVVSEERPAPRAPLLLGAWVLDSQILELGGRRLSRVNDLVIAEDGVVEGVDVGFSGALRRLGLKRLSRHVGGRVISWHDVHAASAQGHRLMLDTTLKTLDVRDVSAATSLVGALPPHRAADVLRRHPALAERALAGIHDRRHVDRVRRQATHRPRPPRVPRFLRHRPRRRERS
jgi:hypothetical protein